jgi:hypothetical protein
MKRLAPSAVFILVLVMASGCQEKPQPPAAPVPAPNVSPGGGERLDPADPKAGLNTNRPDSIKDMKPSRP